MRFSLVVSLVLVACGGDDSNKRLPDAPPLSDVPLDTPVEQDPPVTLTITNLGVPAPGVRVYFVNADDSLVLSVKTDATGTAKVVMAAGGSVTALNPFDEVVQGGKIDTDELRTFAGVKPGDHLVLTRTATDFVTFKLNATAAPGANAYDVFTTCGTATISPGGGGGGSGSPDPGGFLSLENCHGAADVAIVASDINSETTTRLKGLYHPNATVVDEGTVDLTADTYQDLLDVTFTYMNAPNTSFSVLHSPLLAHGGLGPFSIDVNDGVGTFHEPDVSATRAVVDTTLFATSRHEVIDWGPFTTAYVLDMNNLLLPEVIAGPSFNPTTGKVSWTEAAQGATPDLTVAAIRVRRSEPVLRRWHWEIVAPYRPGEVRYPRLPADVFDWTPIVGDGLTADPVTSAKVPGGYDAARAHVFDILDRSGSAGFVAGASGRVVIVQSSFLDVSPQIRRTR